MVNTLRRRVRRLERRWISNPLERARHREIVMRRLGQIVVELEISHAERASAASMEALRAAS
jgi:hypothetical protein